MQGRLTQRFGLLLLIISIGMNINPLLVKDNHIEEYYIFSTSLANTCEEKKVPSSNNASEFTLQRTQQLNADASKHTTKDKSVKTSIQNQPPLANFSYQPLNPKPEEIVLFTDTSIDTDGIIIDWFWDFDNGFEAYVQNPSMVFNTEETYHVTLTVTDNTAATATIVKQINVSQQITGDMNNDQRLNSADIRYLAMYLNGNPIYMPLYADGDVNSNGTVNSADVRYLAMYLNGNPDYSPLYP